jgi:hypothetical protein
MERKFDTSSTVLCNSQWVVDLKTVRRFLLRVSCSSRTESSLKSIEKNFISCSLQVWTDGLHISPYRSRACDR